MKNYGLVSIVMPSYNAARFISESIKSVLAQTYQNWELLIQDDCSRDYSVELAQAFAIDDCRIKIERNVVNSGAAVSRNEAIKRSRGCFVAFLDADDLWLPTKLEKQLVFMEQHNCDFCYCSYEHISEDGKSLGEQTRVVKNLTYNKMLMHCWPGCLTVIYRQDLNHKIYAEDIKKNNDHALFLRVLKHCHNAMGMKDCMGLYRICKGSISRNKFKMFKPYLKVIRDFEGKSIIYAWFCIFTHIFIKFFLKYRKIQKEESVVENMRDSFTLYKDY